MVVNEYRRIGSFNITGKSRKNSIVHFSMLERMFCFECNIDILWHEEFTHKKHTSYLFQSLLFFPSLYILPCFLNKMKSQEGSFSATASIASSEASPLLDIFLSFHFILS